ncbi:MAG TPA: cupin domain-containing protein [Phnomibacter sp.]|nr:cupin domain-containing protein [Phnomibacter sp.]
MITYNINTLPLNSFWAKDKHAHGVRVNFPLIGTTGTEHSAVVYFELEPGQTLGSHTDSAEEILYIVQGTAEVTVGDETTIAHQGALALVPTMMPHNLKNIGDNTVKVVGFFGGANHVASIFDDVLMPADTRFFDTKNL